MSKKFLVLTALIALSTSLFAAEKLATVLRGKVISTNLSDIQVFIKESDGSILDMTELSSNGMYNLDLTIMDTPSQAEVNKLIVEVKNKSGKKKTLKVNQYINVFADTVTLKPIELR